MKQRRKFTAKEKIALTVLGLLMAGVIIAGAVIIIGNVNESNRKATDTAHTTIKLTEPTTTEAAKDGVTEKIADNKNSEAKKATSATEKVTDSKSKTTSSKNSAATSKAQKKTTSKSKSSTTSKADNKVPVVVPDENTKHKSSEKCVVNGTTCYVGDTISVTLNLTTPVVLINYQGHTDFDNSYLKIVSARSNTSGFVNGKSNTILYNASDLGGLDFTSKGTIYTAKFKVLKAGSTTIKNTFEVISDMDVKAVSESSCKTEIAVYK